MTIVGISGDAVKTLKFFKQANNLNFTLLSDINGEIAKIFDVPVRKGGKIIKTINGKELTLQRALSASRWTFILDSSRKIIYKDIEVDISNDHKKVIEFLQKYKQ